MDIENSLYGNLCKFFTLVSKPKTSGQPRTYSRCIVPEIEHEANEKKRGKRVGFSTLFTAHVSEEETLPDEFQLSAWIFKLRTLIPCSEGNAVENVISDLEKVAAGQLHNILPVLKFLSYIKPVKNEDIPTLRSIESFQRQNAEIHPDNMKKQCVPYPVIKQNLFDAPPLNFHIGELYTTTVIAKLESTRQLDELDVVHRNLFGALENPPKNLNYLGISKCSKLTLWMNTNKSDYKPFIPDEGYESPTSNTIPFPPNGVSNYWENLEDLCDSSSIPRTWEAKLSNQAYPVKELPYLTHAPLQVMEVLCHYFDKNLSLVDETLPARDSFLMDESKFRKNILYLMLGIESRVFSCVGDEFQFNGYPFIDGISSDCLIDLVRPLLECGRLVRRLKSVVWNPEFGPVRNTLGDQLLTSLQYYQEMVEEVMKSPSLIAVVQQLKTLSSSLQLMDRLWHWPGWEDSSNGRGVAFLQHLVDLSTVTVNEQERNLLTAYFAACVGPLLSYMEHWIYRGRCSDPHNEFFIRPDHVHLEKRDRNYWINGFAFQPINRRGAGPFINSTAEDDAITGLLNDVYLCGKTVHLLQLCQEKELEHREPSLRIGLSLSELNDIRVECAAYALKFPAVVDFVRPIKDLGQQARKIRDAKLAELIAEKAAKQLDRAVKRNARLALAKAELDEQLELKRAEETKKANRERLLDEDIQRYQDSIDKREADEKRRLLIKYANLLDDKDSTDGPSEDELNANDPRGMDEENNIVSQNQPGNVTVEKSAKTFPSTSAPTSIPAKPSTTVALSKKVPTHSKKKIPTREEIKTKVLWEEFGVDPRYTKENNAESTPEEPPVVVSPYVPKDWSNPASISYPFQFNFDAAPEPTMLIGQEKRDWLQDAKPCEEEIRDLSLSFFVQRSLLLPIRTQCQMVNRSLMTLLTGPDHRFMQHLEALRQYLFLDNGAFSHSLVSNIGRRLGQITRIQQLINVPSMNFILQSALNSVQANEYYASRLSFYTKEATGSVSNSQLEALECFTLRYRVRWPLNLILTEEVMDDYSQIFSFVLQLRLAAWALEDVYVNLMRDLPSRWHAVHIARHSIYHFVQTLQNYVMSQLLTLAWSEFLAELKKYGARSLDDLYELHSNYIHRAKSRLLLTPKSASLLKIIRDALNLALKFRGLLLAANYTYSDALQSQINSVSAKAKEYAKFIRLILEKVNDRSHQSHFNELLVKLNFNEFYSN